MINKKGPSLEVKDFYKKTKDFLKLRPATGKIGFLKRIRQPSSATRSLPVQIWGKKENQEIGALSSKERIRGIRERFRDDPGCIILADNLSFFPGIKDEAKRRGIAVFYSELSQKKCLKGVKNFFLSVPHDHIMISGGLLQISGLGVLIVGDSGVGKSESALELLSRGHRFVCDDVLLVKKTARGKLTGIAPSLSRNFMEIRGLGIINIKEIFGPNVICQKSGIDIVINLKKWQEGEEYDRLGPEFPEVCEILGVQVPQISIPVALGRNIATLIEVACKVHSLREKGYDATKEIVRMLNNAVSYR